MKEHEPGLFLLGGSEIEALVFGCASILIDKLKIVLRSDLVEVWLKKYYQYLNFFIEGFFTWGVPGNG